MRKMFSENQIKEIAGSSPEKIVEIVNEGIASGEIQAGGDLYLHTFPLVIPTHTIRYGLLRIMVRIVSSSKEQLSINDFKDFINSMTSASEQIFCDFALNTITTTSFQRTISSIYLTRGSSQNTFTVHYYGFSFNLADSNINITRYNESNDVIFSECSINNNVYSIIKIK